MGASMKMTVFWDAAPCSLVEVCQRFREVLAAYIIGAISNSWLDYNPEYFHLHDSTYVILTILHIHWNICVRLFKIMYHNYRTCWTLRHKYHLHLLSLSRERNAFQWLRWLQSLVYYIITVRKLVLTCLRHLSIYLPLRIIYIFNTTKMHIIGTFCNENHSKRKLPTKVYPTMCIY
jgi:hypothetical protein